MGGNGHTGKKGSKKKGRLLSRTYFPRPSHFLAFPSQGDSSTPTPERYFLFQIYLSQVRRPIEKETEAREGQYRYLITLSPGARRKLETDFRKDLRLELD